MSVSYTDLFESGYESDCCGATVYLTDICYECHEHCTPQKIDEEEEEKEYTWYVVVGDLKVGDGLTFQEAKELHHKYLNDDSIPNVVNGIQNIYLGMTEVK